MASNGCKSSPKTVTCEDKQVIWITFNSPCQLFNYQISQKTDILFLEIFVNKSIWNIVNSVWLGFDSIETLNNELDVTGCSSERGNKSFCDWVLIHYYCHTVIPTNSDFNVVKESITVVVDLRAMIFAIE